MGISKQKQNIALTKGDENKEHPSYTADQFKKSLEQIKPPRAKDALNNALNNVFKDLLSGLTLGAKKELELNPITKKELELNIAKENNKLKESNIREKTASEIKELNSYIV